MVPQVVFAPGAPCQAQHCCSPQPCPAGTVKWGTGTCSAHLLPWLGTTPSRGEDPLVIISPAWAKAQPCPSALHLLCARARQSVAAPVSLCPAREPLDAQPLASRSQRWPCPAVVPADSLLGVVLCPSLHLQAVLTPLLSPGEGALCAGAVSPCSPLATCVRCSPGWTGCENSHGLSLCMAVCLSPRDFSSPALQVPPFPLLPAGALGAMPGGSPCPVKGPGLPCCSRTGAGQPGLAPGRALPRQ